MSFYQTLIDQTEKERNELLTVPILQDAVKGKISQNDYHQFLIEAYHHVKHTTPLLMACGSLLPEKLEWLREAVGEYIEEEMGHQEWILNDITALGENSEAVRHGSPSIATELMVSYAWDTIRRINPVGFFGMVLVLEGTSVQLATQAAQAIQKSTGLPDEAFSYLTSHGSLDIEHISFFEKLMNKLTAPEDKEAVVHCAKIMYKLYGDIFRGIQ